VYLSDGKMALVPKMIIFSSIMMLGIISIIATDGNGGNNGGGLAPTISALSFNPTAVYVNDGGGQIIVNGSINFSDPDGDLSTVTINIMDAAGTIVATEVNTIIGMTGVTSGIIQGTVTVSTTTAGYFTVQIFATDNHSLRSNQLEGTFRIAEFPWVAKSPMPTPRLKFAAANIGGLIYVIGGQDASALITPKPPMTTMEIYNPTNDSWSTGPSMLVALSGSMAAVVNGKLYIIGGQPDGGLASDAVQEYDPALQTWSMKTSMPDACHSAAVATHNGLIYVAGGQGPGVDLNSLLWFSPATDSWSAGSPMHQSRIDPAAADIDGRIIVYGGYDSTHIPDGGYLGSVESYDPVMDTWSARTSGSPRRDVGVTIFNGLMYTFGGNNVERALDWVQAYDNAADAWLNKTSMPVRLGYARAEVINDKIFVFGTDETLEYTPSNDIM